MGQQRKVTRKFTMGPGQEFLVEVLDVGSNVALITVWEVPQEPSPEDWIDSKPARWRWIDVEDSMIALQLDLYEEQLQQEDESS